jgi:hypothetical protein
LFLPQPFLQEFFKLHLDYLGGSLTIVVLLVDVNT